MIKLSKPDDQSGCVCIIPKQEETKIAGMHDTLKGIMLQ